jgi:hypothetical protein
MFQGPDYFAGGLNGPSVHLRTADRAAACVRIWCRRSAPVPSGLRARPSSACRTPGTPSGSDTGSRRCACATWPGRPIRSPVGDFSISPPGTTPRATPLRSVTGHRTAAAAVMGEPGLELRTVRRCTKSPGPSSSSARPERGRRFRRCSSRSPAAGSNPAPCRKCGGKGRVAPNS